MKSFQKNSFLVNPDENVWISATAFTSGIKMKFCLQMCRSSTSSIQQKTLHNAKERLLAASFKSSLNTIKRTQTVVPVAGFL